MIGVLLGLVMTASAPPPFGPSPCDKTADPVTASNSNSGAGSTKGVQTTIGPFACPTVLLVDVDARAGRGQEPYVVVVADDRLLDVHKGNISDGATVNDAMSTRVMHMVRGQVVRLQSFARSGPPGGGTGSGDPPVSAVFMRTTVIAAP